MKRQTQFLTMLALLLTAATGAWADGLTGSGTEADPYQITSADDWATFAAAVNDGTTYSGQYIKLTANISVTAMVGASETNAFKGTFDGGGKTLTVDITNTSDQGAAPFRYISGATIKNLTVAGTITSDQRHTGGIVGHAYGDVRKTPDGTPNRIEGCTVTATINQGTDYAGGLVGHGHFSNVIIKDCIFAGTIDGGSAARKNIGGILGWNDSGKVTMENCLEKGTFTNVASMHPIALLNGTYTVSNCYYLTPQVGAPGHNYTFSGAYQVYSTVPENEIYKSMTLVDGETYYVSAAVTGIEEFSTDSSVELNPTVTAGDGTALILGTDYTATLDGTDVGTFPTSVTTEGSHTLVLTGKGSYAGEKTVSFHIGYAVMSAAHTTLKDGFVYKLTSDVTIDSRINVSGSATLILCDGYTLTASKGIELSTGNQLTIEGEADNSGTLVATGESRYAGIGAYRCGNLIINGGTVNATGGEEAAGIGGSINSLGSGTITINDGIVNATGGEYGSGIGGGSGWRWEGDYGLCDTIIINGGQVTVTGGKSGSGIGPGYKTNDTDTNSGSLTIGWTKPTDFIKISSIGYTSIFSAHWGHSLSSVTLADAFIDGNGTVHTSRNTLGGTTITLTPAVGLKDAADNTDVLAKADGLTLPAVLSGRTLYKDGSWNTLCLPFDLTLSGSVLDGATAKTLTSSDYDNDTQTLTLTFGEAVSTLEAGKPYIIKWDDTEGTENTEDTELVSPVFSGVTISGTTTNVSTSYAEFVGSFSPVSISGEDKTMLYLGAGNTLYYPNAAMQIGSCRAYFKLNDITAGEPETAGVRAFRLNFGDGEATGVTEIVNSKSSNSKCDGWYTLDGRRLAGKPTVRGIYVTDGKKVVIK